MEIVALIKTKHLKNNLPTIHHCDMGFEIKSNEAIRINALIHGQFEMERRDIVVNDFSNVRWILGTIEDVYKDNVITNTGEYKFISQNRIVTHMLKLKWQ